MAGQLAVFVYIAYFMRTTIDIPDRVLRRAKAAASLDGKTLKVFVTEALEAKVAAAGDIGASRRRARFPLVPSQAPGSLKLDGHAVAEALESDDLDASGGR